jgi:hypothetical protein
MLRLGTQNLHISTGFCFEQFNSRS